MDIILLLFNNFILPHVIAADSYLKSILHLVLSLLGPFERTYFIYFCVFCFKRERLW